MLKNEMKVPMFILTAFSKLHALIESVYFFFAFGISATFYVMIINRLSKRQIPGASKDI